MKSKLVVNNFDLSDKVVKATREKVSISVDGGKHIPVFTEEQVTPTVDVNVTSEVEFDTSIVWQVLKSTITWAKAYGGSSGEATYGVTVAPNGDIIIAGYTYSFGTNGDAWVLRLDSDGNVKWQKAYGGSNYDVITAVAVADNGDIIVAGYTDSFGAGSKDSWILRLDENGNVKWQKAYGGSGDEVITAVTVAPNGDIIIAGYTYSFGAGKADFWALRLDSDGNVKWQKAYGGSEDDEAGGIAIALNGDIIVVGYTKSFGAGKADFWALRLDSDGNVKWQKAYGGSEDDIAFAVAITENGDIIVAGYTLSFGTNGDAWVLRLDSDGNVKWQKAYGGSGWDSVNAIVITDNGDIVVVGDTDSFGAGGRDFWALKLDEEGNVSASQLTVTDTNCTVTDTNCTVTDTNCTVTDTSCTVTDTNCTVTETDCVVTQL